MNGCLGRHSDRVIVGPGAGLDSAIIDAGEDRVMAIAEDPIFPAPGLPLSLMGWFTVHIGASDVAVTGIRPEFMTYTLLLPGTSPELDAREIVRSISDAAEELGIAIVGGHTGWYDAVAVPLIGGVTVWGTAARDRWIHPGGAKDGDLILMTKGPAVEAAALLSVLYEGRLCGTLEPRLLDRLRSRSREITVVKDALLAFEAGGVHAMHDATEGGVLGGLWEMHASSSLKVHADLDPVPVPEDIRALSEALDFDPWKAISEGTLLAAVDPHRAGGIMQRWAEAGIEGHILGRFEAHAPKNTLKRNGAVEELPAPGMDPFWDLFFAGIREKK